LAAAFLNWWRAPGQDVSTHRPSTMQRMGSGRERGVAFAPVMPDLCDLPVLNELR
jgi:hypothetical protein